MTQYEKPLPVIDNDNRPYWEYCKQHELRMQQCSNCGYIRFPVSMLCPKCHSLESEWTELSGKGRIYSFVVYRLSYHPGYEKDLPYVVAIIRLDEGPSMESNIIGCNVEDIEIDMPVEVSFDDVTDDVSLPKFRPATR